MWLVHLALTFAIACVLAIAPLAAQGRDDQKRPQRAATELFKYILASEQLTQTVCTIDGGKWLADPVPQRIAARYLGLTAQADLVGMAEGTRPDSVIVPEATMTVQFCDEATADKMVSAAVETWKWKPSPQGDDIDELTIKMPERRFAFPVFNRTYSRAVVVVGGTVLRWLKSQEGPIYATDHPVWAFAKVYERKKGRWRLLAKEKLYPIL